MTQHFIVRRMAAQSSTGRREASRARRKAGRLFFVLAAFALCLAAPCQGQTPNDGPVLVFDVKGVIGFATVQYLTKSLDRARAEGASAVVMRIDTPGGLVSSTREMIQLILASPIPVIGYVAPSGARAASAGTYLMYASHLAAMAPATHLGAATPIPLGPPGVTPPPQPKPQSDKPGQPSEEGQGAAERKLVNDAVAYLRGLAELRGRNADWAEKAVREGATLTATQAVKENVVEFIATSIPDLLAEADGRTVTTAIGPVQLSTRGHRIIEEQPSWKMQTMQVLADPNLAFILLLIGIYGILFELLNPGAMFPGVLGGISLVLGLIALTVLPVNLGGLVLLLLGIGMMVAEAFTPGLGVVGLGGVVAFVLGALFLFEPSQVDIAVGVSWPLVIGAALASALLLIGVLGMAIRARRRQVRTGAEELIGSTGEVVSWSGSEGRVHVHGEIWAAKADVGLAPGDRVRVIDRTGLTLRVKPTADGR